MVDFCTVEKSIHQAAVILKDGGLIAFPTETYYGLAVDPFNEAALKRLFAIKKRPSVKPLLVLIASRDDLSRMTDTVPEAAIPLMDRFWPGPLTLVFPACKDISVMLTGGTGTVGVRISPHPVAQALLQAYGTPLTATSANRSGEAAAVTEDEVRKNFGDDVDMVLAGGRTPGHKPSTIIGFTANSIECLREGCIPFSEITQTI